jgi:hypothetical protein
MMKTRAHIFAAAFVLTTCGRQEPPSLARVQELEQQVRAIANTEGCDRLDQCAAAPLGAKPCGGPRTFVVYCKATTNEAALNRALEQLKRAEEEYNLAAGLYSDCALAPAPGIRLEGRTCTAVWP